MIGKKMVLKLVKGDEIVRRDFRVESAELGKLRDNISSPSILELERKIHWENHYKISEHSAPSVRTLKIFDITQVTTTKTLQFRHAVLGSG